MKEYMNFYYFKLFETVVKLWKNNCIKNVNNNLDDINDINERYLPNVPILHAGFL